MNDWLRKRLAPACALLTGATLLAACGHTELVYREPMGGQLVLAGNRNAALKQAHFEMAEHCGPNGYRITREEVVVLGTNKSTVAQMGAGPKGFGGQFVQSETVEKERRLTYVCGGGGTALAAVP